MSEVLKLRKDIVIFILNNSDNKNIYFDLINDKNTSSFNGFKYESIVELLIISKCMPGVDYDEIIVGQYPSINRLENIKKVLNKNIHSKEGGNSDVTIKFKDVLIPFSIKYKDTIDVKNDLNDIKSTYEKEKYKFGLFVKDKNILLKHNFQNKTSTHKKNIEYLNKNNLLFDEKDVKIALKTFCDKFKNYKFDEFCNVINEKYLLSKRKQLILKLHQKLAFLKFINNLKNNQYKHIIGHKPRSGKSILMILMASYLLENNYKKILIMTAVPDTINDFIEALETYIDFNNIKYKVQKEDDFNAIEDDFSGIVFSSLQFFKTDAKKKKELLKKLNFDAIFNDECHLGGSTIKTQKNILEINSDTIIDDINKNIKLNIFASGTSDKTKKYYKIKSSCIYEWEIEDEAYMKQIDNKEIEDIMIARHGNLFKECLEDISLNKDYSSCPTPVLMKCLLHQDIINQIIEYNNKNNTNYGFSYSSLLSQKQINNKQKYIEQFELCSNSDGNEMLINILDNIESNDPNKLTVMKKIEQIQDKYGSRISSKENPLLFIIFLPTNTRNNTIDGLQETLKNFIEKNNLWSSYNIEYSNSIRDTGDIKRDYNDFVKDIMKKTKDLNKKGCILLLGNKGGTGITYHDCDVTISLDDGHSIDNQKQKNSRAGTEAKGKTIFINVDMNIQRAYALVLDKINRFRSITKKDMTNDEIIYYLYKHEIFLFDPLHYNNNNFKDIQIKSYYKNEVKKMMNEIDISLLLEDFVCGDDLKDIIKTNLISNKNNTNFEGDQKDCPKPNKTPIDIDPIEKISKDNDNSIQDEDVIDIDEEEEELINKTSEMFTNFMIHLLGILSRSTHIINYNDIFDNNICKNIILKICEEKEIDLNNINYDKIKNIMNNIIDINIDIVNSIREIYINATPNNIRSLIEKYFIPSKNEQDENAEIPTPVKLVDEMLSKIPPNFWTDIHTVFEPCCGKGNFVLGIFDMFYKGLEKKFPDKVERCKIIMTKCIYYADLTTLNVFITTEILKCHIEDKCGVKVDYEFNSNTGNTLTLDIDYMWNLKGFNAVIGNPPYNKNKNKRHILWNKFIENSLNKWLLKNGYLLFVNPGLWRKPISEKSPIKGLFKTMVLENTILYLEIHNTKDGLKTFRKGTRYDWYLIEKTNNINFETEIVDENNNYFKLNLKNLDCHWLPNTMFDLWKKIINKNDKIKILYSRSNYGNDKKWMSRELKNDYKHKCILSTPSEGIKYMYSNHKNNGHFNIKKVIFGETGTANAFYDKNGDYGLTDGAMAIIENDPIEANNILKCLKSDRFLLFLKACSWSNYRIEWNMFLYFNKDFWKEFIDEESIDENVLEKDTKIYTLDNKENNKKYTCVCGSTLNKNFKIKHEQSLKHKKFIDKDIKIIKKKKIIIDDEEEFEKKDIKIIKNKKIIMDNEEDKINYNKYTVNDLKNLLKEKGIKIKSKIKKQELINLLTY